MKLSKLLAGAVSVAFAAGLATSASAAPASQAFSISGTVVQTCLLNFPSSTFNLGAIPINTNAATSSSTYFHMTAPGFLQGNVNGSGGCNSNSNVTLVKAAGATGLHNPTTAGYDQTVFTADMPYNFQLSWTGSWNFISGPQAPSPQSAVVTPVQANSSVLTGAFASPIAVFLYVPDPGKGLLAGTYSDTVTLTFTPI